MTTFDLNSTSQEVATAFKDAIIGKNVVITGVRPHSLGGAVVHALAPYAKTIIIASRTVERVEEVLVETRKISPQADIRVVPLDLSSGASVRKAAAAILEYDLPIHVLINNAGLAPEEKISWTEDGFETQIAVDHLGPFLFTSILLPALLRSKTSEWRPRVVYLSSLVGGEPRLHDLHYKEHPEEYERYIVYGQCKTANVLAAIGLSQRYDGEGILAYAVHPGVVWQTTAASSIPKENLMLWGLMDAEGKPLVHVKTPEQGGATILYAAFAPALGSHNGAFLADCAIVDELTGHVTSQENVDALWKISEDAWKIKF